MFCRVKKSLICRLLIDRRFDLKILYKQNICTNGIGENMRKQNMIIQIEDEMHALDRQKEQLKLSNI